MTATVQRSARAGFALLVIATVAAFFVTQRLKTGEPAVKDIVVQVYMSPNGDGLKDVGHFAFTLPRGDRVTLDVDDAQGDRVRRLLDGASLRRGRHSFRWDGLGDDGVVPHDGHYFLRVVLRDQGRAVTSPTGVILVTRPPRPRIVSVSPRLSLVRRPAPVTVRFTGPASFPPVLRIWRTDGSRPHIVAAVSGRRGAHILRFSGRVRGRPLPPGNYSVSVTVRNLALVTGSFPANLPPSRAQALPGTGFTVLGTVAAGPLEPVNAGDKAHISIEGGGSRVRWHLARIDNGRTVAKGDSAGPDFPVHVSSKAETGLYVVTLDVAGRTARVPLVIRGKRPRKVLVVLPTISWQGANPVDEDADGFPDTLFTSHAVPLARPFANGALPAEMQSQAAPLLRFLAAHGVHYELTTDLALARGRAPLLRRHTGVLLVGPETWTTALLGARLQAYVRQGGRVATFGVDSLQRAVVLTASGLQDATPPASADTFGESLAPPAAGAPSPLVASSDRVGLFEGTSGFLGRFVQTQPSHRLPRGARLVAAAARGTEGPALVAYRLGRGMVIRFGTGGWTRMLQASPGVARVTQRAWALISR